MTPLPLLPLRRSTSPVTAADSDNNNSDTAAAGEGSNSCANEDDPATTTAEGGKEEEEEEEEEEEGEDVAEVSSDGVTMGTKGVKTDAEVGCGGGRGGEGRGEER